MRRCEADGTDAGAMAHSRIANLPDTRHRAFMRLLAPRIFGRECDAGEANKPSWRAVRACAGAD
jgi:hypothetical protein